MELTDELALAFLVPWLPIDLTLILWAVSDPFPVAMIWLAVILLERLVGPVYRLTLFFCKNDLYRCFKADKRSK